MLQALIAKRLAALAISFAVTTAIPFALKDRPRILWVWNGVGPVIVEKAADKFDLDVKINTPTPATVPPAPQPST